MSIIKILCCQEKKLTATSFNEYFVLKCYACIQFIGKVCYKLLVHYLFIRVILNIENKNLILFNCSVEFMLKGGFETSALLLAP